MGLSSTTSKNDYTGDGATSVYAYSFKVFNQSELLVTVRNTSTGAESTLTITTDYTVSGVGDDSGGNVTLVDASQAWLDGDGDLLATYELTIKRVLPLTQETDIRNQGAYYPEGIEDQFDKIIMIAQQQQDSIDRSVKLPETIDDADFDPTLPAGVVISGNETKTLIVNAAGNGLDLGETSAGIAADVSAAAASAAAALVSETNAGTSETLASEWASKIDGIVDTTDYSAKAWAIGGTGVTDTASAGASKEWATKTSDTVDTSEYSAKEYATGTQRRGASGGGSAKDWAIYEGGTVDDTDYSAKYHAAAAAASASAAATAAAAGQWTDVEYLTSADSPKTLVDGDAGKLFVCDTSSGAITVNLPGISGLTLDSPWSVGIKKENNSANDITVSRNGTDVIDDGDTSVTISRQGAGRNFIPDVDDTPDSWTTLEFGEVPIDGAIVGTSDTQTFTNKTIDADNNTISNLAHGAEVDNPTSGVHGATGTIVGTSDTQTLTNKTLDDELTVQQISTPSNPSAGYQKIYPKSDGLFYTLDSSGNEVAIGTGGSGKINLFEDYDAENASASDWTDSSNMTTSINTTASNVARGNQSFQFTATAGSETAESASLTVPLGYRTYSSTGKYIFLTFMAKCAADFTIELLDKTNTTTLISETVSDNSSTYQLYQFSAYYPDSTASVAIKVTSSASQTVYLDDVFVGFEGYKYGATVAAKTDWTSYSPTVSGLGTGTLQNEVALYKRDGEDLLVIYSAEVNAVGTGSTDVTWSLPSGLTIDETKAKVSGYTVAGPSSVFNIGASSSFEDYAASLYSSTTFGILEDSTSQFLKGSDFKSSGRISFQARVPIVGWTATSEVVVTELDNVAPARAMGLDSTGLAASTVTFLGFENADTDYTGTSSQFTNLSATHNTTYSGTTYWTCPRSGFYSLSTQVALQDADMDVNERMIIRVYIDGTTIKREKTHKLEGTPTTPTLKLAVADSIYFNKDEKVSIAINNLSGGTVDVLTNDETSWFSVVRQGKSPIAALDIVGKWTDWTPTGSWTSNVTYTGKRRQVGENMEYQIKIALSGIPTNADLTIDLPSGDVIDTSNTLFTTGGATPAMLDSTARAVDAGNNSYPAYVTYVDTTTIGMQVLNASGTYGYTSTLRQAVPFAFNSGDFVFINFSVPLVRLSRQ